MAGIAIVLDLIRKNQNIYSKNSLHSFGSLSSTIAISGVASSIVASYPFAFRSLIGSNRIAYCDATPTWSDDNISKDVDDFISKDHEIPGYIFETDALSHVGKVYNIELKPLLSAFQLRTFALTTLRSFLMYYLPLLEARTKLEDDDEDFLVDNPEPQRVDLIAPFHKSVKQIIRESTVVTTRRVLERVVVSYFSQRMAWKLLKDAPKSALRKAQRGMPSTVYCYSVARTTLRAHFLGVAASWIVQVGIDIYRCLYRLFNSNDELEEVNRKQELELLNKKIFAASLRCTSSLIFAAIGAGIGATVIRPSLGQWIGCAAGDLAGPTVVAICLEKYLHSES